MKSIHRVIGILAMLCLRALIPVAWAHDGHDPVDRSNFESGVETEAKPWTHLDFRNDPDNFQFAIVSDRTGGPRQGVFEDAIEKLNWMQPEFVMSVGDLIQGTSENSLTNAAEWDEMMGWIEKLEMPFFFAAGNHDIQAKSVLGRVSYEVMRKQWEDRFGTTYYYYKYKGVLFIALFSNDGIERHISNEQVAYFEEVLAENQDVRWTMLFLHHPLWDSPHDSNFGDIEAALEGRDYTVFAGHQHMYRHFERKNTNYYVLATTGGGSGLRGNEFGEFDHITWVTMTDEGPRLANIRLDGILPHNVTSGDVKEYSMLLTMSASIDAVTLLEENENVEAGMTYLTFNNRSLFPIEYKGTFFHNHYIHPTPGKVKVTVPPRGSETVTVSLQALEAFRSSDKVRLEFEGTVAFASDDAPALEMSGRQAIRLATTKIDLIEQESIAFTDSTQLRLTFAPEGTDVRYTLDGSEPDENSLRYDGPLNLENGGASQSAPIREKWCQKRCGRCSVGENRKRTRPAVRLL